MFQLVKTFAFTPVEMLDFFGHQKHPSIRIRPYPIEYLIRTNGVFGWRKILTAHTFRTHGTAYIFLDPGGDTPF
jgi:hypothetical protein